LSSFLAVGDVCWRSNGKREINDVSDRDCAEQAWGFLDFRHVFTQHAQWKRPQAFRAGLNDKGHPLGILSVPWYPDRSRLPVMVNRPCGRGSLPPNDLIESGSPVSIRGEGRVVHVQQNETNGPFGVAVALANIDIIQ
jgi:hypothetical protein